MKNKKILLFAFFFIFFSGIINAQINVNIIDNINGNKVVFKPSITTNPNTSTILFRWNFGDGSAYYYTNSLDSFTHTYPNINYYIVELIAIDTSGILPNDTSKRSIYINCIAKFEYTIDNQKVIFHNSSETKFTSNYNYYWNFGDGSSALSTSLTISPKMYSKIKNYIVTLKIGNSEKDYCSIYIDTISIKCVIKFDDYLIGDSVHFTNISQSVDGFSGANYSWDFGNGDTSNIEHPIYKYPISDSNYYVTLSISNNPGCNGKVQQRVVVGNPLQDIIATYYKQDTILLPVSSARLYLIQFNYEYDSLHNIKRTYTFIDSVDVSNDSVYIFKDINPGNYIVKMALLPTDPDYLEYIPTYFGFRSYTWMKAEIFSHTNQYLSGASVNLHKIQHANGNRLISGYVYDGETPTKEPLENMDVYLISYKTFNYSGTLIEHTKTDVNGKYEFNNLENEEYRIQVEMLGKPSQQHYAMPDSNSPVSKYYNFDVIKDSIVLSRYPASINSFQNNNLKLYPNPVNDFLNIDLENDAKNIAIEIYDISGSLVLKNKMNSNEKIDVSNIKTGIYFIQIQTDNLTIYRQKFLKD